MPQSCGLPGASLRSHILAVLILLSVGSAAAAASVPTMYYLNNPVPSKWVATPLPDLHFSWSIQWDSTNTTATLIGTFNYTAGDMWVSIGLKSASEMDGLCVICYVGSTSNATSCTDWNGSGYGIDQARTTLTTVVSSYYSAGGVQQVVFSRPIFQNGKDLGVAAWSSSARVIWGWGPMGRSRNGGTGKPGTHPGRGIAASVINFQTGEVLSPANPNTHLVPVYVCLAYTLVLGLAIHATIRLRIPVHHRARDVTALVSVAVYVGLWVWYIVASIDDYTEMGRLLPSASATGDAAACCLAALIVSGSRRFIGQDFWTVSHERMMAFHAFLGVTFVASMLAHAFLMIQMFTGFDFVTRWNSTDRFANLPGLIAGVLIIVITIISLLRHRVSYRFFRHTHGLWVIVVIFVCLHVPRLTWCCVPGLVLLALNLLYGRMVNLGSCVEGVLYDAEARVTVLDISRPYWPLMSTGSCRATGLAPGQWFYLGCFSLSLAWHPISVARSQIHGKRQYLRFFVKDTGAGLWTSQLCDLVRSEAVDPIRHPDQELVASSVKVDGDAATDANAMSPPSPSNAAALPATDLPLMRAPGSIAKWTWMEGPFGRQQLPLETYPSLILASGGVGVTPHLQTLQYLAEYSTQLKRDGVAVPWRSVLWMWTFKEPALLALVAADLAAYSRLLLDAGVNIVMHNACTGAKPDDSANTVSEVTQWGRLKVGAEIKNWSGVTPSLPAPIAVYSCGPAAFIDGLKSECDTCTEMTFHHHVEVFEV